MSNGCSEYNGLTRRGLFTAALSGLAAITPTVTYAQDYGGGGPRSAQGTRDVLVTVYLRGGCDGLTLVNPFADPAYYTLRPNIAVPRPDQTTNDKRGIALTDFFSLPQGMQHLKPVFDAGHLAIVHAAGSTDPTKSHFDAQFFMEAGRFDKSQFTGWVGRHLATVGEMKTGAILRAVGLGANLPLTIEGAPKATAVPWLEGYDLGGDGNTEARRTRWLQTAYANEVPALKEAADNTIKTVALLKSLGFRYDSYATQGATRYNPKLPNGNDPWYGDLGNSLKAAAALLKKDVGIEAIHVDTGGWDTHDYADPLNYDGGLFQLMWSLSGNLRAFYEDLSAAGKFGNVTVLVLSEFGRRAAENGNRGTDHGHGNVMFVMGQGVRPGVHGRWPGLASGQLWNGEDLDVTTDYRDVACEIISKRLANAASLPTIFPGHTPKPVGVIA